VFTLVGLSYTPGANNLQVYLNGVLLRKTTDYTETSSTVVTLASGALVGDSLTFISNTSTTSSVQNAAGVAYTPAGTGAVATNVQTKLRESVSVKDFGAVGDGTTDDTAAIQAAITAAQINGQSVYLPAGNYLVSNTLTLSKQITLFGDGIRSFIKVAASVGATTDIIKISPSSSDDTQSGFILKDFRIGPVSGTPGRHAIAIDITTRAVYASQFSGLRLDALGGKGFVVLPNATPLVDGFFTSVIQDCTIANGMYLDEAGDSIRILNNIFTGANVGIYLNCVFVSSANTPHGVDIIGNSFVSSGGGVHIKNGYSTRVMRNLFETSAGNANNAQLDIDGTSATEKPDGILVEGNFFTTPTAVDSIRVNYARMAQIVYNTINEPGGGGYAFRVTANAVNTQILFNPTSSDSAKATQLTDAGTNTFWMRSGLSAYAELSKDLYLNSQGASIRASDTAGTAIRVVKWESADNTLNLGVVDAAATNGILFLYAQGVAAARINANSTTWFKNKINPGTDAGAFQSATGIYGNTGAPNNANGIDGDFYFRADGGALTSIYHKRAGAWVGIV
jgi:hypothetical protein